MFHFFPEENISSFQKLYSRRRTLIIAAFLLASGGILCLSMLPAYVVGAAELEVSRGELSRLKQLNAKKDVGALEAVLSDAEAKRILITHNVDSLAYSSLFDQVSKLLPSEIRIDTYRISGSSVEYQVFLSGKAATRESLVSYAKKLRQSGLFSSVEFPISRLASEKDISFDIDAKK